MPAAGGCGGQVAEIRDVRRNQWRMLAMIAATVVILVAAQVATATALLEREIAFSEPWIWRIAVPAIVFALFVILVAVVWLRAHARERRREIVERALLDLLATPRNIEGTAGAALRALHDIGLANASVVALAGEGGADGSKPLAARGFPRGWRADATPAAIESLPEGPTLTRPNSPHIWFAAASADLGSRPWLAVLPLRGGEEPVGVVLLAARAPGALRDRLVLDLLTMHLSAAFDHAALYEAAYARERALEDMDLRRREFMAAIAHEIRTPLTSIQAFSELLQAGQADMDETAHTLVASLGQGVQQLSTMVTNLIDLGRSGETGYALESTSVDLAEIVRDAEATLRPALVLREQTIALDLPPSGPAVRSDPRVVQQVVMNLLANANRHAPPGGRIAVVATQLDRETVRLEVSDDGEGIPERERQRIFEPYYRVNGTQGVPGSGLGLAVVRRLLEETGGRIWAGEAEGGGARFSVELRAYHPETVARE